MFVSKIPFCQRVEGDRLEVEFYAAGLESGDGQHVLDDQAQTLGIAGDGLEEFDGDLGIVSGAVEEGFDIAFNKGKRGAQLMADVGDEIRADGFELLETRQIVEDEHGAVALAVAVDDGRAVDLEPALAWPREFEFVTDGLFFSLEQFD